MKTKKISEDFKRFLIDKFNIKICWGHAVPHGEWYQGKKIWLNPKTATNYTLAHEVAHSICGYGCCREHCEFEAHGGAKVLCKLYGLKIGNAEKGMDGYAQRTNPIACGRFKEKDSWVEEVKKEERKRIFNFEEFLIGNESGKFFVNPSWLEHLLNLFYQGYIGEVADEINDTIMNQIRSIRNVAYGIIGQEFDKKHLPKINGGKPQ